MANRNPKHQKYVQLLNNRRWWGEVRVDQLRKHPLCQLCEKEGIVRSAVDVHHITPVESVPEADMERVCYDPNNLISLCIPHHIQVHKDMRSHQGQMLHLIPHEEPNEERKQLEAWVNEVSDGQSQLPPKPKRGVRHTKYGWMTRDEVKAKQEEEVKQWIEDIKAMTR